MSAAEDAHILGLCFSDNALYFALKRTKAVRKLRYIGKVDFSFSLYDAFARIDVDLCSYIQTIIGRLIDGYPVESLRMVSFPQFECWTNLPKLAYDDPAEREAHLSLLSYGVERKQIETTWYEMSSRDFRLLAIRDRRRVEMLNICTKPARQVDYCTDFEIGQSWMKHSGATGSFMSVGCYNYAICVSSFVLGKLRGSTCLRFEHLADLPFVWKQSEAHLRWMNGYHEEVMIYGTDAGQVLGYLRPLLDENSTILRMQSLEDMGVEASEKTYSFPLEKAFPAIMMALDES
ncbi:MAG: hypothetical protein ACOC2C_08315 [Cyclonatronaceae bacterium]